ncbi:MAG: metallophosphoesterase, partial [Syntrophothermus sp.]
MKQLKFLHIADLHADSDPIKRAKFEQSAIQIVDYCMEVKVNAVIIAGDVFDRKQTYAFNTGVPAVHCFLGLLSP